MIRKRLSSRHRKIGVKSLSEHRVSANPFDQFNLWFQAAIDAKVPQPYAMTLATASRSGRPSARIVLLKGFDPRGFSFYTNYESVKGKELTENRNAALLFYWPKLERQIRIEGSVEKLTREESLRYFQSRPRKSRIGTWASHQSEVLQSRESLDHQFRKYRQLFHNADVPLPEYWGGYLLIPSRIEFWQSRSNRLHDRVSYLREDMSWKISRLSP